MSENFGRETKQIIKAVTADKGDSGSAAVSIAAKSAITAYDTLKTSQKAVAVSTSAATATYKAGQTTFKVVRTADYIAGAIKYGLIPLDKQTIKAFTNSELYKIRQISPKINTAIEKYETGKRYVVKFKSGTVKTATVASRVLTGQQKIKLTKSQIQHLAKMGVKTTGRAIKTGTKVGIKTSAKTSIKTVKATYKGISGAGNLLAKSEDESVRAVGNAIKTADHTTKAIKTATKTTGRIGKKVGKGVYRTGKGFAGAVKTIRHVGAREASRIYGQKLKTGLVKAGNSVASAILNFLKAVLKKYVIPIFLVIVILTICNQLLSTVTMSVSSIFSGSFVNKDTGEEVDTRTYLTEKVNGRRTSFVNNIIETRDNNLKSHNGNYDYVRVEFNDNVVNATVNSINNMLLSKQEIVNQMEPVFQAKMFCDYDDEPTQKQADDTFEEIWNTLFTVSQTVMPIEYCNSVCDKCGHHHANANCPEKEIGVHTKYECSCCCYHYYVCNGCEIPAKCTPKDMTKTFTSNSGNVKIKYKSYEDCPEKELIALNEISFTIGTKKYSVAEGNVSATVLDGMDEYLIQFDYNSKSYTGYFSAYKCTGGTHFGYHETTNDTPCCNNCTEKDACNGYCWCKGHTVLKITIGENGYTKLINKYFVNPINELESKGSLTEEEKKRLIFLKDEYDLCQEYYNELNSASSSP